MKLSEITAPYTERIRPEVKHNPGKCLSPAFETSEGHCIFVPSALGPAEFHSRSLLVCGEWEIVKHEGRTFLVPA